MSRELDRRSANAYLHSSDAITSRAAGGVLALEQGHSGYFIQRALAANVQTDSSVLGLEPGATLELIADPLVHQTSSGAAAVHLQQQYKSIPIFQAAQVVSFAPDGSLERRIADSVLEGADLPVEPKLSVSAAVRKAAVHVATDEPDQTDATDQFGEPLCWTPLGVSEFEPKVMAAFPELPSHPTVLEAGPFAEPIKASFVWCPFDGTLRLTWQVTLTLPNREGQYLTLVDADSGEILYCAQLMQFLKAQAQVYRVDGGQPRELVTFPLNIESYGLPLPLDLPREFPDPWLDDENLTGNSAKPRLGLGETTIRGKEQGGVLTFDPADVMGDEQKVLNVFYYDCLMHDLFYLLGFREQEGNFQCSNLDRGGAALDAIDARIYPGPVQGTASMQTPVDGKAPIMSMGLVTRTGRHTAFDSSVVFHEYTHGVSNRLVGGPMNSQAMQAPQSRGIGEGLSDYVACTVTGRAVVGSWCVNSPNGIRAFRYDSSFPDHFGDLGLGRYREPHNVGEIWCATLLEMNRNIGSSLSLQLAVDALKLAPSNPSFLQMRDAILLALAHMNAVGRLSIPEHETALEGAWRAFAKFGMGPQARSDGAGFAGIVADFNMPALPPSGAEPRNSDKPVSVEIRPSDTDPLTGASKDTSPVREGRRLRRRSDVNP